MRTYVCVSKGKKFLFFGKFSVLWRLETPVLRFALLPYYRRIATKDLLKRKPISAISTKIFSRLFMLPQIRM